MKDITLSARLLSVAALVRQGACFADIGTDHAYLPIFLKKRGIISCAICADINEGPLASAVANAEEHGLSESFEFVLTDGARGLENKGITDAAICGMGGELIAKIIDGSPFLKSKDIRLVLQPMTKASVLRNYLAENGFSVLSEVYSYDSGKYYVALSAEYTGALRKLTEFEAEFGEGAARAEFFEDMTPEKRGYIEVKIRALLRAARGKAKPHGIDSYEASVLTELRKATDIFDIDF